MSQKEGFLANRSAAEPYSVTKERLKYTNADLTSFYFPLGGANFYVFSYEKGGRRKHTFVDAGDPRYGNRIQNILAENDVNPANIERIIITHRHSDHCGLVGRLAKESHPKILVHSNFSSLTESKIGEQNRRRWDIDPSELKGWDIEYLLPSGRTELISINGIGFQNLVEPIEIEGVGKLLILACPKSAQSHSPDQIIVVYSPRFWSHTYEGEHDDFRPTDAILFSGDLWLMSSPRYDRMIRSPFLRFRPFGLDFYRIKRLVSGKSMFRKDPQGQDLEAREALKQSFSLIRVKPGHGKEFLGSRIIPNSLLSDRDLLVKLGYSLNADKSILRSRDVSPKIVSITENAYTCFVWELLFWKKQGYSLSKISELLVRIYKEQSGGPPLIARDRKQRRERLKSILARLRNDQAESDALHHLASSTLSELRKVL